MISLSGSFEYLVSLKIVDHAKNLPKNQANFNFKQNIDMYIDQRLFVNPVERCEFSYLDITMTLLDNLS